MYAAVLVNGVTFAAVVYMASAGLGLAFGLMRIVNLNHGSLYLLGGYLALSSFLFVHNWYVAALCGAIGAGFVAALQFVGLLNLRAVRVSAEKQTLITLGLTNIFSDIFLSIWGGHPERIPVPNQFYGVVQFGGIFIPRFRLFVLLLCTIIIVTLWVLLNRTKLGMIIRAAIDDREIVKTLGFEVKHIFLVVFLLAGLLAGFAGAIGGTLFTLGPGEDARIFLFCLTIVLLGGMGTFWGTVLASLIVGILYSVGVFLAPQFSLLLVFGPLAITMLLRPQGLFGREA